MWCDYHQPIINYDDTLRVLKLRKYLLKYRHALQIFVKILYTLQIFFKLFNKN